MHSTSRAVNTSVSTQRKATTAAAVGAIPWTPMARPAAVSVPGDMGADGWGPCTVAH